MINRKDFAQEQILREHIRGAIKVVKHRKNKHLQEETQLRDLIRSFLIESQAAVATTAKHENTGINVLEDLLKNSNILSVVEKGYTSLTTRAEDEPEEGPTIQQKSYRNHILVAVEKSLAPEESRKEADEDVDPSEAIVVFRNKDFEFSYEGKGNVIDEDGEVIEPVTFKDFESEGELLRVVISDVTGDRVVSIGQIVAEDDVSAT